MSRSNDDSVRNPATKFFEWNGDKGGFKYYDKALKDQPSKGIVPVPYPFRFIVLENGLMTVKGYSKENSSGLYSNEVKTKNLKTSQLTVKTKNGVEMTGTWEQVKAQLAGKGAAYSASVYIGYFDENKKLVIGNIQFHGASIGPWFDFGKSNDVMKIGIQVKSHKEGKVGSVIFQSPVFEVLPITPETNTMALELDKQLQEYLKSYFARDNSEEATPAPTATAMPSPQTHGGSRTDSPTPATDALMTDMPSEKQTFIPLSQMPEDDLPF